MIAMFYALSTQCGRRCIIFDLFLSIITILSGIITVITGSVTIIGYFSRKPVSPSQPDKQSTSHRAPAHQVYVQPPLPYFQTTQQLSQKRNRLSHPKIALIALLGQVLLFFAVSLFAGTAVEYVFTYGSNPSGTSEENSLAIFSIVLALGGLACAITALVMSLVKTKQLQRWGWFTSLIIGIFGPTEQKAAKTQTISP
jgi:uncharacterized membrane protein HdeD (DUF308 family)